jgi:hypothetical protein
MKWKRLAGAVSAGGVSWTFATSLRLPQTWPAVSKAVRGDQHRHADDDDHQDRHEHAVMANADGIDPEGQPDGRKTAQQMADMRQRKMTQCRAYRQHRLAQEGEGIAEKAQPCGTRRPVDKGDEKSRRQAEAARQPDVFRTGAGHDPREGGKRWAFGSIATPHTNIASGASPFTTG